MVPAPMKKQLLPVLEKGFVLKRSVFNPCLELYPMEQWNKEMEKIGELNQYVKENVDFLPDVRLVSAGY